MARIAVAKLISTFRRCLSPLLTTVTSCHSSRALACVARGCRTSTVTAQNESKWHVPRMYRWYMCSVSTDWDFGWGLCAQICGQFQTASVKGYCCHVCGCFRPEFVSSGTKTTITKKAYDCPLLQSCLTAPSVQPLHLERCLGRLGFMFYHAFPKTICWLCSWTKGCLSFFSVLFDSKKCSLLMRKRLAPAWEWGHLHCLRVKPARTGHQSALISLHPPFPSAWGRWAALITIQSLKPLTSC